MEWQHRRSRQADQLTEKSWTPWRDPGGPFLPFRDGMPGPVKNLNVIAGSWVDAPVDVNCSVVTTFQAQVVRLDGNG